MHWIPLTTEAQLNELIQRSHQTPQLIFKHSTRCSISMMVKSRLDKSDLSKNMDCYYLDLLTYRAISNKIAFDYNIQHQSPQVLLLHKGECVYYESQHAIYPGDIDEQCGSN